MSLDELAPLVTSALVLINSALLIYHHRVLARQTAELPEVVAHAVNGASDPVDGASK